MEERILKYLHDILNAIYVIESYLKEKPNNFKTYSSNIILKRAIERDLEIIGEAVRRIRNIDSNFPLQNAQKIIGLRNQIIHAYDNISDENIWAIIQKHLPLLKKEVSLLIRK